MSIALDQKHIAIIGSGKMGEIITSRLLATKAVAPTNITCTDHDEVRLTAIYERYGVHTTKDNRTAVNKADVVILCIKPQNTASVLGKCKDVFGENTLCISIMAGVTTTQLEGHLPEKQPVIRVMPNTIGHIGKGLTVITNGAYATDEHFEMAEAIFSSMGTTEHLDEKHFDAVTALSASGPAFVYLFIEALADGGVKCGLPRDVSIRMAAQLCQGAAAMVNETGLHPAILKDEVTTPAGCTIDGLLKIEEGGLRVTLIKAVAEAARRAGELAAE